MSILPHNFLVDQLLELVLAQVVLVLVKVKELLGNWRCSGLVLGVVVGFEVRVLESLLHRDALDGVEGEELLEKVQSQLRSLGEEGLEGNLLLEGKRANVLSCTPALNAVVVLHRGCTENVENQGQLVVVWCEY